MGNVRQHSPQTENKRFAISKVFFVVGLLISVSASAFGMAVPEAGAAIGINRSVNYQGRLMDSSGNPVADGVYQITFRLYAQTSGGSQLWSASTTDGLPGGTAAGVPVQVKSGLFSVLLGDTSNGQVAFPDNLFNNDSLYLGVKIAADSEMTPRKRLSAVPYAYNSETLQGQYASHTVANTGGDLFGLRQASTDAANATRTALYVETKGTSDVYDFLMRMSDGSNDVFSVNRQGNVTVGGILDVNGDTTLANASATSLTLSNNLWVSGTASSSRLLYINATGTNLAVLGFVNSDLLPQRDDLYVLGSATNRWKGIYAVSVTSTNVSANFINAATVSTTNLIVNGASVTTSVPTWQQVTNQGNVTNKDVQFAGGTSTADFRVQGDLNVTQLADLNKALFINATGTNLALIGYVNSNLSPMADNFYSLGDKTHRWKRLYNLDMYASGTVLTQDFGVYGNLSLPNDSITDLMASNGLTINETGNVSATSINSGVLGNAGVTLNLSGFGSVTGTIDTSNVRLDSVDGPFSLRDFINSESGRVVLSGGDVTQFASGTVSVTAGDGYLRDGELQTDNLVHVAWGATNLNIDAFGVWENIYAYFNDGNPIVLATTTDLGENRTYYKIASIWNGGNGILEIHDERLVTSGFRNKLVTYIEDNIGRVVEDGCVLTDKGSRALAVSECTLWYATMKTVNPAFDSSGSDTFALYYRDGSGGWTTIDDQSQWDNQHIDDGSGTLANVGGDEYGVQWVYSQEGGGVRIVYGRHSYATEDEALSAAIPTEDQLPPEFKLGEYAFLIGALVFQQGVDAPVAIQDLRPQIVTYGRSGGGSGSNDHNSLSGLQGGAPNEYYHIRSNGFMAVGELTFSSNANNNLTLLANGTGNNKVIVNNIYAGKADLDIIKGDLLLASTTRITNTGHGYLSALDVTGLSALQELSFTYGTGTYLYLPGAKIDSLASQYLDAQDAVLGNATATYIYSDRMYSGNGIFDNISAEQATFTHLVVMENTDIHNLTFTNATGGNLVTYGAVSSTFINVLNSILGYATSHNMVVDESLRVGVGSFPIIGNSVAQFGGDTDDYLQVNIQNHSTGTSASSDYVATADNGDDSNYYIDMGINSSNYSVPEFSISGPNDGYLYVQGANLTIGTASASTDVIFHAGGTLAENEIMRLTSDGYVGIGTSNPSSTLDVVGTGRFTGLLTLNVATTSELFWGVATGTSLHVVSEARLPSDTLINNVQVCLADGTNCPSGTTPNLQTVTNTGNVTTNAIQFAGGTSTADFRMLGNLTVDGGTSLQNLLFTNATGLSLSLMEMVSTTRLVSGDAILANTVMQNATASNMVVIDTLRVGVGNFPIVGNSVAQYGGTMDGYLQVNIQNHSASSVASSDFVATADNGDDSNYYIDMGINSSNYDVEDFSIQGANDGYLYVQGANLAIGTASASTDVIFHAGGTLASDEVMRVTSDHYVGIGTTNPSSTLDVVGDGRFTGLLTLNVATTSELFWGVATGTSLHVVSEARLPSDTLINNVQVCLADGTNCPSGASPNLQTVSNSGNTTTRALQFGGGTSTGSFRFLGNLTVDGGMSLQNLLFTHATGLSMSLMEMVSTTRLVSGDAILANTVMQNATASSMVIVDALRVGTGNVPIIGNSVAQFGGDFNDYLQVNIQNRNSGPLASSDYIATADVGDDSNYFMDMGIANSGFNDPRWEIIKPLDGYLYAQGGDLDIGATSGSTNIIMFAGGVESSNEIMRITSDHYVGIGTTNPSSTLDVVGTGRFTGLLTLNSATTSDLFWGNATGTTLRVTGLTRLPSNTLINNTQVCLADGTNCPSGTTPNLQTVTNTGKVTTNDIQFNGGTSTGSFLFQTTMRVNGKSTLAGVSSTDQDVSGYMKVNGKLTFGNASGSNLTLSNNLWASTVSTSRALFINATGTNLAVLGRINSDLNPMKDVTYVLGTQTYRWLRLNAANVSSTNADLSGYLNVTGKTTLTNVSSTNQDVSGYLKVAGKLGFVNASGTNLTLSNQLWSSTVSTTRALFINATGTNFALTGRVNSHWLPMHDNTYDLGSSDYQWRGLYVVNATATGIVTTDLVATGNVDLGIGGGQVNIISNLSMSSATSQPRVWWTNSNAPSTGVNSVRTMGVFNAYLYAGQGDAAGLGDLLMCDPTIAGNADICDNASDWSKVIDNASASQINTMSSYYGRLYVGEGKGAGLGVIRYCRPELTGNSAKCESADWAVATTTSFTQIRSMIEYNGYFYAAADSANVAGKSAVLFCDPTKGGANTDCDNPVDWASVPVPIGTYEEVPTITVFNGRLYALTGNTSGDGDYMVCTPNTAGASEGCDVASDWTRVLNNSGTDSIESSAAYNGFLFNGTGNSAGKANVQTCNPAIAGDRMLCDNANDFSTIYNSNLTQTRIPALVSYGAHLFFGAEGATGDGNIYDYNVSYVTTSHKTATFQATYSFAQYNGYLYAGRGNAAGNGQVWYYRREKSMSNALSMVAGRSLGSMWFDEDSLDSLGPGSSDSFAKAAFKFSHGIITDAGAYDLAETYPTNDSSLEAGEVVSIDENNQGYVRRSNSAYEKGLMGVISSNPGFLLSGPQNGSSRAVALVGRVGVRVSLENGDIKAGDPLTSSAKPGYAMKATRPGMIIGHALGSFTSSTAQTSTSTNPTLLVVVQPGYYFGDDSTPVGQLAGFFGESTSTQVVQQAFQGDTYAIGQVAGGLINPQVANGSDINSLQVANVGTLIVRTAALVAGDLTVGGTSRLMGHVVVSQDSAGVVDLPAGEQYVEIRFVKPYESAPVVVVTPESDAQEYFQPWMGKFRVGNKTVNGFRIYVEDGACVDPNNCGRTMRFNWMAVGIQPQASDESASSTPLTFAADQTTNTDATIGNEPTPEVTDTSTTLDVSSVAPTSTQETVLPDQTPASDTDSAATTEEVQPATDTGDQAPAETVTTQPTEETTVTILETITSETIQTTEGGEIQ